MEIVLLENIKNLGQIGEVVKFDKGANKVLMKMPDGKSLAFSVGTDIALTPEYKRLKIKRGLVDITFR